MKKTTIVIVLAATISGGLLQSCTRNSQTSSNMQKPVNEPQVTNAGSGTESEGTEAEADGKGTNTAAAADPKSVNFQNMQDAFKGETTASAKYAAYSKKAEAEGYHAIALLFKAASASENIHANNHKAVLEESGQKVPAITPEFTVKSTKENLIDAIGGEGYEVTTMYPEFLKNANTAGNQLSLVSLNYAYKTEQKHKVFYEKALAALENNTAKTLPVVFYICSTCGNTYETTAPKRCGISMTSSEKFIRIDNLNTL